MQKILLVEDEETLQKTLGDSLRAAGFEVLSAFDGEAGLALAKEQKPDLILLDLILPKKDGFEVFDGLKGAPETESIPVIILTNLEQMQDVERAMSLGAKTYLVKANYSLGEVVEKVKKVLS